jgi:two-component system NarL family response regulator
MPIRFLLADDHRMFRETLCHMLEGVPDLELLGQVGSGKELLDVLARVKADLVVLDVGLPDMSGIELARKVRSAHPLVFIVALSGYTDRLFVDEMLKAGAKGYVAKSAGADDLVRAMRAVMEGNVFLSPEVAAVLMPDVGENGEAPLSLLGKREREILGLLASGKTSPDIALLLGISVGTVQVHRRNIKAKLGLRSVADLTRYAIRQGLAHSQ